MKKRKTYEVSVINKTYSKTYSNETKFYTSDTALELNFQLKEVEYDFDSAEIILLNIDDRSLATRPVAKSTEGFTYELEDDITARFGEWKGQLKFSEGGEVYVSSPVSFRIENDLKNDRPPQLTDIRDWETLRQSAKDLIVEVGDAIINESERIEAEKQRVEGYQEVRNLIDNFFELSDESVFNSGFKNDYIGGSLTSGFKYYTNFSNGKTKIIPVDPNSKYSVSYYGTAQNQIKVITADRLLSNNETFTNNASYLTVSGDVISTGATDSYLYISFLGDGNLPYFRVVKSTTVIPINENDTQYVAKGFRVRDITPNETTFAKYAEETPERVYQTLKLSDYYDASNDGKMMEANGSVVQTGGTTNYTYTDPIPVFGGSKYRFAYRKYTIFDSNNYVIGGVDNPRYGSTPTNLRENTMPENASYIIANVHIDQISTALISRLTPTDTERDIVIPNLVTNISSRFKGKVIAHFGDSITGNYPNIVNTIQSRLGNTSINLAIGGAKMSEQNNAAEEVGGGHTANSGIRIAESIISGDFSTQRAYTNAKYSGTTLTRISNTINLLESTDFNTIDYATVQFGANDYLQGIPIGNIDSDRYTFMGAYRIFLETIIGAYPNIKFILVSTPITYNNAPKSMTIADYVQATKEVADYFNLPFLDNYTNAGINQINRLSFFNSNDGVHPKDIGLIHLGNRIASAIEENY